MTTITTQLADALRGLLSQSAVVGADESEIDLFTIAEAEQALAAYDAQQAQSAPSGDHTPEPWRLSIASASRIVGCGDPGGIVAECEIRHSSHGGAGAANARRIVACVNFMAGTPTHHIEALTAAGETFDDYASR